MLARTFAFLFLVASISASGCAGKEPAASGCSADRASLDLADADNTVVLMDTNKGCLIIELFDERAPITVENFKQYVEDEFYDNSCFHRVIPNFVAQGGGFDRGTCGTQLKEMRDPIPLETTGKIRNEERTLAMARTSDPDSATSQFYINVNNNCSLDPAEYSTCPERSVDPENGYAAFGRVVEGWEAAEALEAAGSPSGTPKEPLYMVTVRLLAGTTAQTPTTTSSSPIPGGNATIAPNP